MISVTPSYKAIVAIDFGTSRSGYAYAFLAERAVNYQTFWPGQKVPTPKTLTQLLYAPDGQLCAWGFEVEQKAAELGASQTAGYQWYKEFKKALYQVEASPTGPVARSDGGKPAAVLDLIVTFITKLKDMALQDLRASSSGELDDRQILWVLTVPALWSQASRRWMREAAVRAGLIGPQAGDSARLMLALEPEAAALYCLQRDAATGVSGLRPGTRFMVIDAGGGTVDLTVHEVTPHGGLDEVIAADGAMHGSTDVDRAFHAHAERLLGKGTLEDFRGLTPFALLRFWADWELIKCGYDHTRGGDRVNVPFPVEFVPVLEDLHPEVLRRLKQAQAGYLSYLYLSKAEMAALFAPTIDGIVAVVARQFERLRQSNKPCQFVFLVGGLAGSSLLRERLSKEFGGLVDKIVTPSNPGAAVLQGAALYGLRPGLIGTRRSRYTYGVRTRRPFVEGTDPPQKKVILPQVGPSVLGFKAYVMQGQALEHNAAVSHLMHTLPGLEHQKARFYSIDGPPPKYFSDAKPNLLGEMVVQIPPEMRDREQRIQLTMHFGGTEVLAEVRELASGKPLTVALRFHADAVPAKGEGG